MKTYKFYPETVDVAENLIYTDSTLTITNEGNEKLYFHITDKHYYTETLNVAEAVAIMMCNNRWESIRNIWNIKLRKADKEIQSTTGTILWLSGGSNTWKELNLDWLDFYSQLDYEYGYQIRNILKQSKTLNDVRTLYRNNINLDKMYNSILKLNTI